MALELVAREKGRIDGEVILYRMPDGRFRVYRHIPGVGGHAEVGSDYFASEEEARRAYDDLVDLLRRMNARPR